MPNPQVAAPGTSIGHSELQGAPGSDRHPVAEALSARGVPFVYSTGNTGHGSRDGYSGRPVLKKPFKYEELVAIFTHLKFAPVD